MKYYFYKITKTDDPTMSYIGSTKNPSSRKSKHKKNVNNKRGKSYWTKLYQTIRCNGGWEKFTFTILEDVEYDLVSDCLRREQELIVLHIPTLNSNKAFKEL